MPRGYHCALLSLTRDHAMTRDVNRQFILAARPKGLPTPEEVPLVESPVPTAGEGEIVIRNHFISLDPAIRGWMSDEPNYIEPIPVGTKVWATGIGRVGESGRPEFAVGDIALGRNAGEDYTLCPAAAATKIEDTMGLPLTNFLSVLGATGLTAYFGLLDVGDPQPGEVLLVSGAAGAVGSIVGQIGKIKGCRVIGIAGGPEKIKAAEHGFKSAIGFVKRDLSRQLELRYMPSIEFYYDDSFDYGSHIDKLLKSIATKHD